VTKNFETGSRIDDQTATESESIANIADIGRKLRQMTKVPIAQAWPSNGFQLAIREHTIFSRRACLAESSDGELRSLLVVHIPRLYLGEPGCMSICRESRTRLLPAYRHFDRDWFRTRAGKP
jgi:hypothetical protein